MTATQSRSGKLALLEAENAKLRKINQVLMGRVERSMDLQGNDFSLFETAILLEGRVNDRTAELRRALDELQRSNAALEEAKRAADEANLSKTRFLAAASHDILQPLNAARLFLSALGDTEQTAEARRLIGYIDDAFESVERLLGALLDISKLDAGVMRPAIGDVDLGELLKTTATEFRPVAEERGLKLRYVPVRCTVRSDGHLLVRVIRNFLSNAIRYTKEGGVLLGVRRDGDAARIEVYDTGAGMPPDKLDEIFEEFRRLVGAAEDYERGFGLGLAIVRRIVRMLDHPLTVRSVEGRGSCFAVTVPVVSWTSTSKRRVTGGEEVAQDSLFGAVVCVIENEPAILEAMQTLLRRWGSRVLIGTSADEVLAALSAAEAVPDVVIADYHLDRGENGIDAIEAVRGRVGAWLPGVVVTADRTAEVRRHVAASGCSILNKPVRPGRLRSLVAHLLTQRDEAAAS
ncbi:MAG: hybrid sensor histidine kinase/response regulator [Pseudomonadota bacterium]